MTCPAAPLPGARHVWAPGRPLDVSAAGVLVETRRCVWCHEDQARPYVGPRRRRGRWATVTNDPPS